MSALASLLGPYGMAEEEQRGGLLEDNPNILERESPGFAMGSDPVYGSLFDIAQGPTGGRRRGKGALGDLAKYKGDIPYVPEKYEPVVMRAARKYGINPALLAAVGQVESGWSPDVNLTSSAGALGPMQVMPFWQGEQPYNIHSYKGNIMAGAHILNSYLQSQANRRSGLAAYNAGPGNIGAGMDYASLVLNTLRNAR